MTHLKKFRVLPKISLTKNVYYVIFNKASLRRTITC